MDATVKPCFPAHSDSFIASLVSSVFFLATKVSVNDSTRLFASVCSAEDPEKQGVQCDRSLRPCHN